MARAKTTAPDTATVSAKALRELVAFVDSVEAADAHYQSCQATLFRDFVRGAHRAANLRAAAEEARRALGE